MVAARRLLGRGAFPEGFSSASTEVRERHVVAFSRRQTPAQDPPVWPRGWGDETGEPPLSTHPSVVGLTTPDLVALAGNVRDRWLKADIIEEVVARRADESVPTLVALLHDDDRDVRRIAADGLAQLGAASAVPAIARALDGEIDPGVRADFAEVLEELRDR